MRKQCSRCEEVLPLSEFHNSKRNKSGKVSSCKSCESGRKKEYRMANPERMAERDLKFREESKDSVNKSRRKYYEKNKQKVKDKAVQYKIDNPEKIRAGRALYRDTNRELVRAGQRRYKKENPHKDNEAVMRRYASKKRRTPKWLTGEHIMEMQGFYKQARILSKEIGQVCHVDHIVPLLGKNVCGLHVPWNLQILIGSDNLKKSNKHES